MRRALVVVFVLGSLLLALPSRLAAADDWDEWARGVDATDPAAVRAAREKAEKAAGSADGFWLTARSTGRVLDACARDLPPEAVASLFEKAGRDRDKLNALTSNFAARDDLPRVLLERKVYNVTAENPCRALIDVAIDAAVHREPALAHALLSDPRSTLALADDFVDDGPAEALQALADAAAGRVALPASARACLGDVNSNLASPSRAFVRRLGRERVDALQRTATTDPDPAIRVLCARILHVSLDPDASSALFDAYLAARDPRVEMDEWEWMAFHHRLAPTSALKALPERERIRYLWGYLVHSHTRAGDDLDGAEEMAAWFRRIWDDVDDPRARGHLVRLLDGFSYAFVDDSRARPFVAPSWRGLVDEWGFVAHDANNPVGALAGRVFRRRSRAPALRAERRESVPPDKNHAFSPVLALLRDVKRVADVDAARVASWLEADPDHLLDLEVAWTLSTWEPAELERVLDLYPPGAIDRLLERPPSRYRSFRDRALFSDDAAGTTNRARLLALLVVSARQRARVVDARRIATWPAASRRELGELLGRRGDEVPAASLPTPLDADDEFAIGYAHAGLVHAQPAPLAFATRVLVGDDRRPSVRGALADIEEFGPPERLASVDDELPSRRVALDDATRARLSSLIENEPDPYLVDWAARRLALAGAPADVAVLLTHEEQTFVSRVRSSHPLRDLASAGLDATRVEQLLGFVAQSTTRPRTAAQAYEDLALLLLDPSDDERAAYEPLAARLLAWTAEKAPTLANGLSEATLGTLLRRAASTSEPELATRLLSLVTDALPRVPVEGVRLRLAARLDEVKSAR